MPVQLNLGTLTTLRHDRLLPNSFRFSHPIFQCCIIPLLRASLGNTQDETFRPGNYPPSTEEDISLCSQEEPQIVSWMSPYFVPPWFNLMLSSYMLSSFQSFLRVYRASSMCHPSLLFWFMTVTVIVKTSPRRSWRLPSSATWHCVIPLKWRDISENNIISSLLLV